MRERDAAGGGPGGVEGPLQERGARQDARRHLQDPQQVGNKVILYILVLAVWFIRDTGQFVSPPCPLILILSHQSYPEFAFSPKSQIVLTIKTIKPLFRAFKTFFEGLSSL